MKTSICQRFIFLATLLFLQALAGSRATAQWIWMGGDSSIDNAGRYGIRSTPSPSAQPGHRYYFASWKDAAANLWLFGGSGFDGAGTHGQLNDLWKYNPLAGEWTWISGDATINQHSVYGTRGVADPLNKPGARQSAATWTDAAGNFWLFGGVGYALRDSPGSLSDLWKYNPAIGQWAWMSGDTIPFKHGKYGEKTIAAAGNTPGGRSDASGWIDPSGSLWLFGGFGDAVSTYGYLNDLWKYDPKSNQWTWISGDSTVGQNGVYGTIGNSSPTAMPGGRTAMSTWMDLQGNTWLFGGSGLAASGSADYLNDLWKYDPLAHQWTWVAGDSTTGQPGQYGTRDKPSPLNQPGSRNSAARWTDANGRFWLFGGIGHDGFEGAGYLSDLWTYDPTTRQWTWYAGDNKVYAYDSYGAKGIPGKNNKPCGRYGNTGWADSAGNFWLFGGYGLPPAGAGYLNDVWVCRLNNNSPLPALPAEKEGVKLAAAAGKNTVIITWKASKEQSNGRFNVQRGTDGLHWRTIGVMASYDSKKDSTDYSFVDENPVQGMNYYRLQQLSAGQLLLSNVAALSFITGSAANRRN